MNGHNKRLLAAALQDFLFHCAELQKALDYDDVDNAFDVLGDLSSDVKKYQSQLDYDDGLVKPEPIKTGHDFPLHGDAADYEDEEEGQ